MTKLKDFYWSILGLELEVRVDDSEINLEQTVGNGDRPNRWDTPRMEWLTVALLFVS